MRQSYIILPFTVLLYMALFSSVILKSYLLFWLGAISLVTLLVIYSILCKSRNVILLFTLVFVLIIGYALEFFYQSFYNGTLLPIADMNFSMQLVKILLDTGHLFPSQGSFRGASYSYFPVPFMFGSIFIQVTGLSLFSFAFYIYPLVNYFAILTLFSLIVRRLIESRIGQVAICIFALNGQLLFFYSVQVFHYEQIAWSFSLATIYSILRFINGKKITSIILASFFSFLCVLSHHFTSYILLACLFSFILLSPYTAFHKKFFMEKRTKEKNRGLLTLSLLILIIIVAIKNFSTFLRDYKLIFQVLSATFDALLGIRSAGIAKFNPWNYSTFEFNFLIIGNVALLLTALFAFLYSIKQQGLSYRLIEIMAISLGVPLFMLFQFSQFRSQEVLRLYMPYTMIAGLLISNQLISIIKARRNYQKLILLLSLTSILVLFFIAQVFYAKFHIISNIGDEPVIFTINVKASIDFILNNAIVKHGVIAYPPGYFESLYAKLMMQPIFRTTTSTATAIATEGSKLLVKSDYLILYSPLNSQFISDFIKPDLRNNWIASVSGLDSTNSRLYDNEKVIIYS